MKLFSHLCESDSGTRGGGVIDLGESFPQVGVDFSALL